MNTLDIWKRADLHFPPNFDTIFFDVDGVLIKTTESFSTADIAVAEYVASNLFNLDWGQQAGRSLVTLEERQIFKQAGGFNNDWDMCYLLASFAVARLREWRGTDLAERSIHAWAELERIDHLQGRGGRAWVEDVVPASARPDYQVMRDIYQEYYWGAQEHRRHSGHEPQYLPLAPGLVARESMLFPADFFARLRAAGIVHLGIITGRFGLELESALQRLEAYCGSRWWDVVVSADLYAKPDPQALRFAIHTVGAHGGLYIGDTADDFDVVRHYRTVKNREEPDILAAMLVAEEEDAIYQQRGADLIVRSVEMLLEFLPVHPA